jgi:hypothetical protein
MRIPRAARAAAALVFPLGLGALPARLGAADASGLAATLERFDHLQVGDAIGIADRTLASGHFQCTLKSGRAAPVRAGDEVVGLFFEGDGAMEYVSADPIEAPVVAFNTRKASSLSTEKTEKGTRLRSAFKRLLWLAGDEAPGAGTGSAAASLADSFRTQREKFLRVHWAPPSYAFAYRSSGPRWTAAGRTSFTGSRVPRTPPRASRSSTPASRRSPSFASTSGP